MPTKDNFPTYWKSYLPSYPKSISWITREVSSHIQKNSGYEKTIDQKDHQNFLRTLLSQLDQIMSLDRNFVNKNFFSPQELNVIITFRKSFASNRKIDITKFNDLIGGLQRKYDAYLKEKHPHYLQLPEQFKITPEQDQQLIDNIFKELQEQYQDNPIFTSLLETLACEKKSMVRYLAHNSPLNKYQKNLKDYLSQDPKKLQAFLSQSSLQAPKVKRTVRSSPTTHISVQCAEKVLEDLTPLKDLTLASEQIKSSEPAVEQSTEQPLLFTPTNQPLAPFDKKPTPLPHEDNCLLVLSGNDEIPMTYSSSSVNTQDSSSSSTPSPHCTRWCLENFTNMITDQSGKKPPAHKKID